MNQFDFPLNDVSHGCQRFTGTGHGWHTRLAGLAQQLMVNLRGWLLSALRLLPGIYIARAASR